MAKVLFLLCTLVLQFSFFSCKSTPEYEAVEPLRLIDCEAPLIVYIPAKANKSVVEFFLTKMADMSAKNVSTVTDRTENVAVSADFGGSFQIAVEGSYPKIGVSHALTAKNGWTAQKADSSDFPFTVYSSEEYKLQLANPDSCTILVSSDVSPMLNRFEAEQKALVSSLSETQTGIKEFPPAVYEYLTDNKNSEIHFWANNPAVFFNKIAGKAVNLGIKSLYGSLTESKSENTFALTLNLELSNDSVTKAAVKILKLALFPIPAKIVQTGPDTVQISDISLSYNQLFRMIKK